MIFILNTNPTSLRFYDSWLFFNMISEFGLARGFGFETSFCNLFLICLFESTWRTLFGLFDISRAGIELHVRDDLKRHDIHIKHKSKKLKVLGELVVF